MFTSDRCTSVGLASVSVLSYDDGTSASFRRGKFRKVFVFQALRIRDVMVRHLSQKMAEVGVAVVICKAVRPSFWSPLEVRNGLMGSRAGQSKVR